MGVDVITAHWTTILAGGFMALMVLVSVPFWKTDGAFDFSPLLGCGLLMLGAILGMAVLLAHDWGWM